VRCYLLHNFFLQKKLKNNILTDFRAEHELAKHLSESMNHYTYIDAETPSFSAKFLKSSQKILEMTLTALKMPKTRKPLPAERLAEVIGRKFY
jgi:hypothetical protein